MEGIAIGGAITVGAMIGKEIYKRTQSPTPASRRGSAEIEIGDIYDSTKEPVKASPRIVKRRPSAFGVINPSVVDKTIARSVTPSKILYEKKEETDDSALIDFTSHIVRWIKDELSVPADESSMKFRELRKRLDRRLDDAQRQKRT